MTSNWSRKYMPKRAFQWDLARQVERIDWLVAQLPLYAEWGYQELYIHLEDAVEFPSLPQVGRKNAYSYKEFSFLVNQATSCGIKVIPIVNLLGHTQYLIKVPELNYLNECLDNNGKPLASGQVCPVNPDTIKIAELLIRDIAPFCTAGKLHVGLDESYHLGKHPFSRKEIDHIGLSAHFARYVGKLNALCNAYGLILGMWADMLALLPDAISLLPRGISAYDWYYYPFNKRPKLELRNFDSYDVSKALKRQGIDYWGCPMNGPFRYEVLPVFKERLINCIDWWKRCLETKASGYLVTSWETQRMGAEIPRLVDAAVAGLWLEKEYDPKTLLELGCKRIYGKGGRKTAQILWKTDRYPYSGYTRWMINSNWKSLYDAGNLKRWRKEDHFFKVLNKVKDLETSVSLLLRLRGYIAARDLWVRESSQQIDALQECILLSDNKVLRKHLNFLSLHTLKFKKHLISVRSVAKKVWARTRNPKERGPNELMLIEDLKRLEMWNSWLVAAKKNIGKVRKESVFGSPNRLLFTVENKFPALQRISIQQQHKGGSVWKELFSTFFIEFLAKAAVKKTVLEYPLSIPLIGTKIGQKPSLRVSVQGFGKLYIRNIRITDGITTHNLRPDTICLGQDAPKKGFPVFDWTLDKDFIQIC